MIKIYLPEEVKRIIRTLAAAGYEAYAVGGCVRDSIMGKEPADWDITTSAKPENVKATFARTIDTGIEHGTVTVLINGEGYEVTTYRVDGKYLDGRHPLSVNFTMSLRDDVKRRDFTINALAYSEMGGLKDYFNGLEDINNHIIRAVGVPDARFNEDALRMMRAIRFSAQLGFNIELETYRAIKRCSPLIQRVSIERIQVELTKTILSSCPEIVREYYLTGIFLEVLPELHKVFATSDAQKVCSLLNYVPPTISMRYAALLSTLSADEATKILRKLKLDNKTIQNVGHIISHSEDAEGKIKENDFSVREAIYKLGPNLIEELFIFEEAQIMTKEAVSGLSMRARRNHLKAIRRIYEEILERGDCVAIKDLAVTGSDLLEVGMKGPRIGTCLDWLMKIVLENPKLNEKETLMAMVNNL